MPQSLPPLNAVRVFEAAARHLSFGKAADELAVTPAAVSHQIRALEAWLGAPLFVRRARHVRLTDLGDEYARAVRSAIQQLTVATRRARAAAQGGRLTAAIYPSFAMNWLVPRLGGFRQRHTAIELAIMAEEDYAAALAGGADVAVMYRVAPPPGYEAVKLFDDLLFPVCSPKLRDGDPPLARPLDLAHHTLLREEQEGTWPEWLAATGLPAALAARQAISFSFQQMVLQAAVDGQGVALASRPIVGGLLATGLLVDPFPDVPALDLGRAYWVIAPAATAEAAPVRAFRDWLLSEAATSKKPGQDMGTAS